MNGIRRLPIAFVLAVLVTAPFAAQAATPCTDCCQLPCVEAEIRYALRMQAWYRTQIGSKQTYEAYEAAESAMATELAKEREKGVGVLPACKWNTPDPKDPVAMRYWYAAGWTVKSDDKGNVSFNYGLRTNLKDCTLREDQVKKYHEVTPCAGIADAAEKHERFHVTKCQPGQNRSVAQIAQNEVDAYKVELEVLENLRKTLEKVCEKKTCTVKHEGGDVKKRLEEELELLRQVLAKKGVKK